MARLVHYHHPQVENYSLTFSSPSASDLAERRATTDNPAKAIGYPFDPPLYVLYESSTAVVSAEEVEYDREWLAERVGELSRAGQVVVFRLVELLQAAVDARDEDEFRLYKQFEPQKVQQAIDHVSWDSPLPRVAGEVMSDLIIRHSLPNANHRTAIAMLQFCIESVDPAFEMPGTHVDDESWKEWVDPYIVESKRLITVRRNNVRFDRLLDFGVDIVERKDGIQIHLADFELDMHWSEALSPYAERHEDHCVEFARTVLNRAEREDLTEQPGPTRSAFVDYLEELGARDFRELF
jgi:hypothetical protein